MSNIDERDIEMSDIDERETERFANPSIFMRKL